MIANLKTKLCRLANLADAECRAEQSLGVPEATAHAAEHRAPPSPPEQQEHLAHGCTPGVGCPPWSKWSTLPWLVLDLESYYDDRYSLTRLNYISYAFDDRFKAHGLAVRYADGRSEFATDVSAAIRALQEQYGPLLEKAVVVGHNLAFDLFVLHYRYGLTVANLLDTLLMARLVHGVDDAGRATDGGSLRDLAVRYGLPAKGDVEQFRGVRDLDAAKVAAMREYACRDVEIEYALAQVLYLKVAGLPLELWLMEHSIRMFVERPFCIHTPSLDAGLQLLKDSVSTQVANLGVTDADVSGNKRFCELLRAALHAGGRALPMKPGARGPIPALARNDATMQALLHDPDERVRKLAEARLLVKALPNIEGRLQYLLSAAKQMNGVCPFQLNYHGTLTGRFSGGNGFNIQNIAVPARTAGVVRVAAEKLRQAITAAPGHVLVAVDASQIEARVLSFIAGETDLHRQFAEGTDVYSRFASQVFGCEVRKPGRNDTPEVADRLGALRTVGKIAVLGLGYGLGVGKFTTQLQSEPRLATLFTCGALNTAVCAQIVYGFRDAYPAIKEFWTDLEQAFAAACDGCEGAVGLCRFRREGDRVLIELPSGRSLVYPRARVEAGSGETKTYIDRDGSLQELTADRPQLVYGPGTATYGGKLTENITSAIARDCLAEVIYRVENSGYPVVLHCHDEVVCQVEEHRGQQCLDALVTAWRTTPGWIAGLVLDAEGRISRDLMK